MSAATYFRVGSQFWQDASDSGWDNDTRLIALYVLTSPHRITEGLFRLPVAYVVADTGFAQPKIEKALKRLERDRFMERDGDMVLIRKALKWQAPRSEANAKHAVAQLKGMRTPLLGRLLALAIEHSDKLADAMRAAMPELSPLASPHESES